MKKLVVIIISLLMIGCASNNTVNYFTIKTDKLAKEYIVNDIINIVKNNLNLNTKIVINNNYDSVLNEILTNRLRGLGFTVREINHIKATIEKDELELRFIIDYINDSKEEKEIKKINNDNTLLFRISLLLPNKILTKTYKIYTNTYEIVALSNWIEAIIINEKNYE